MIKGSAAVALAAILILSSTIAAGAPTVKAQQPNQFAHPISNSTLSVNIVNYGAVITPPYGTRILGEVSNDSPYPVGFIVIAGQFSVPDGRETLSAYANPYLEQLRPGDKSPFSMSSPTERLVTYNLTLNWNKAPSKPAALRIEITGQRTIGKDLYEILGLVTNTGRDDTDKVKVVAAVYDKTGRVIDATYTFTDPQLLTPGQSGAFQITGLLLNRTLDDVKSVKLTAESPNYFMIGPQLELNRTQHELR